MRRRARDRSGTAIGAAFAVRRSGGCRDQERERPAGRMPADARTVRKAGTRAGRFPSGACARRAMRGRGRKPRCRARRRRLHRSAPRRVPPSLRDEVLSCPPMRPPGRDADSRAQSAAATGCRIRRNARRLRHRRGGRPHRGSLFRPGDGTAGWRNPQRRAGIPQSVSAPNLHAWPGLTAVSGSGDRGCRAGACGRSPGGRSASLRAALRRREPSGRT